MKHSRITRRLTTSALLCVMLFMMLLQVACAGGDASQSASSAAASALSLSAGAQSSPSDTSVSSPPEDTEPAAPAMPLEGLYEPEEFTTQAGGVYLVNEDSGVVVYAKNADQQFVCASLVKLMTCIITMDMVQDIDAETVTAEVWVFNELYGKNASHADIWQGETLTIRELLYAMLLPSANEAALMTASYVSGGYMANFLYLMNRKAEELGCTGTVFADPNGLSEGNLTTARDMYLIMRAFMQYPVLVEIAGTVSYEMAAHNHSEPYTIHTTNRLLVSSDPYAQVYPSLQGAIIAGKTGSLGDWQNFCSVAEKEGVTYYCAVLQSPAAADTVVEGLETSYIRPALVESAQLYDWAYKNFAVQPALDTTKPITEVTVKYSTAQDSVKLLPASDLKTVLPFSGEENYEMEFDLPESIPAPVTEGQVVGTVTLRLRGQVLGTVELVASQDVARNNFKYWVERAKELLKSPVVLIVLGILAALIIGYVALLGYANYRYKKRKEAERRARRRPPRRPPPR